MKFRRKLLKRKRESRNLQTERPIIEINLLERLSCLIEKRVIKKLSLSRANNEELFYLNLLKSPTLLRLIRKLVTIHFPV
jgi:hypothetical protein